MRRRQQPAVECLAAVAECTKTSQPHNRYVHVVFTLPAPLVPVSTRSSSRSGSENTRFWADGRQSGSYAKCWETLELYRDAPFGGIVKWGRDLLARSIKPFGRGRPWVRWTRALWKFN